MRFALVTAPTLEPVTVEDALTHCRITDSTETPYVAALVQKARLYIESRLQRQLITATWKLYLDDFPGQIEIRKPPVATVPTITYTDPDGVTRTLTVTTDYQISVVDKDAPGLVMPAYGEVWPSIRSDVYDPVCVNFTAGYGSVAEAVPQTLRHAILMLVSHWYREREPLNIGNIVNAIPMTVDSLLASESWGAYA